MISKNLSENKEKLIKLFHNTSDLIVYNFETNAGKKVMISYIEGLVDRDLLDRDILKPLIRNLDSQPNINKTILVPQIEKLHRMDEIVRGLTNGSTIIFLEDTGAAHGVELNKWDKRAIGEPSSESVVRGPKDGFVEDMFTNKSLLRRKLKNNNLVFEDYVFGEQTNTNVSIAYIDGIVNQKILQELRRRFSKIDIDSILESGYIEELIEDNPKSLFATISNTQKPDTAVGKMLEGRVAILTDGTPHVLIIPRLLIEGIMTSEDYYLRPYYASFLRIMRFISIFVTVYLPGLFVALQLYHQEMIPTVLLISMAGAREGVPFPVIVETLLMMIALELTKESGLRLPKSIGSTVSIVGALILGQAAVQAGVVSAITIIVMSVAAISEFIVPQLVQSLVLYRLMIIILGGLAGLYGVACGFILISMQVVSMDSFGVPFFWPLAPKNWEGLEKDSIIRMPIWKNIFRPRAIEKENVRRQIPPFGK